MKKVLLLVCLISISLGDTRKTLYEGLDSKIEIIVFESLTCSHCATFHKEIYPIEFEPQVLPVDLI